MTVGQRRSREFRVFQAGGDGEGSVRHPQVGVTRTWLEVLGEAQFDVVLSTRSLHWLWPDTLDRVYHDRARLLRPGGLFLNGEHLAYSPELAILVRLSQRVLDEQWSDAACSERDIETAEQWWDELGSEPVLAPLLAERARLFARKQRQEIPTGFDVRVAALRRAGFGEVGTVGQVLSNRVVMAVR